ncbi:MAG: hypothetical protein R3296_07630 [Oleiphilaceae bacterium]|nr:hypothetical protein [Oleiphilaceae bacterium]
MRPPQFLKFEFDEAGQRLYPTAVAWSLENGQIKSVVLMPEPEWLPDDSDDWQLDEEHFKEHGVPPVEVIREMNEDLAQVTVYTDGLGPDEELRDLLFETLNHAANFEMAPISALLPQPSEELTDRYSQLMFDEGLDPRIAESGVYALLLLAREEGLLDALENHDAGESPEM